MLGDDCLCGCISMRKYIDICLSSSPIGRELRVAVCECGYIGMEEWMDDWMDLFSASKQE